MGNSKFLDGLSKEQYQELTKKLWTIQNHKCFICEEEIDLDIHNTNIDHIKPLVNGGKDDVTNFGLTHEHCNKSKKDADLVVAKKLVCLDRIIEAAEAKKETPSLKHVLAALDGSKYDFKYKIEDGVINYAFPEIGDDKIRSSELFVDPLSNETTCFIRVPIEYIFHDEIINPRGINSSISLLIKEFHKPNPQLHLSLARLNEGKIMIFDGQHKAVAQLMLGVRELVIRLFVNPDVDRLIETNTNAGSKLKQIAFDKSIVRQLHDVLYAERIRKYQKDHFLPEDNLSFSEQMLVNYFKGEKCKVYVINSQKNSITRSPENKLSSFINFEGRGNALPLSYSTFEKTFLSTFVNAKTILNTPINYKIDEGLNPRVLEKEQLIKLCNILADELLVGRFDDEIGTYKIENNISAGKGDFIPDEHLVSYRLFKEEIMYNWIKYLELLVKNHFAYSGEMYDDENLFMQKIPDVLWDNIKTFICNLRDLPIWRDRSMAATVFGGKQNYDFWSTVFKTAKAPDGSQLLVKPINVAEMIRKTS